MLRNKINAKRRGFAIPVIFFGIAALLFAHAASPQNAPNIETFKARLTPVPIDVSMQAAVAGIGEATAVLRQAGHHLGNVRRTAFARNLSANSPGTERSSRARDIRPDHFEGGEGRDQRHIRTDAGTARGPQGRPVVRATSVRTRPRRQPVGLAAALRFRP